MAMFDKLVPQNTRCIRDGEKLTVPSDFLTPGDVIEIKLGDIIPADVRILSSRFHFQRLQVRISLLQSSKLGSLSKGTQPE